MALSGWAGLALLPVLCQGQSGADTPANARSAAAPAAPKRPAYVRPPYVRPAYLQPAPAASAAAGAVPAAPDPAPAASAETPKAAPAPEQQNRSAANAGAKDTVSTECADLLKLAASLKTEVDRTNKDELSVPVVLDARQIELMARKMREDTMPR